MVLASFPAMRRPRILSSASSTRPRPAYRSDAQQQHVKGRDRAVILLPRGVEQPSPLLRDGHTGPAAGRELQVRLRSLRAGDKLAVDTFLTPLHANCAGERIWPPR